MTKKLARPAPQLSAVVVNARGSAAGRLYSLLRELVHILLGGDGPCTPGDEPHGDRVEASCKGVAAAALVPGAHLEEQDEVGGIPVLPFIRARTLVF